MNHQQKTELLVSDLASRGVGKMTIAPPAFALAWKLGIPIPPPHFLSFGTLALMMGGFFGVFWGILMWLVFWKRETLPAGGAFVASLIAGILYGLVMASYYRWKARKLGLPSWRDYGQ